MDHTTRMDPHLVPLLTADMATFDSQLQLMPQEDLVQLVKMIQTTMHKERFHCDAINQQVSMLEHSPQSEETDERRAQLNAELVSSQHRFAQLCAKNVKCTSKKNPELERKTLSSLHREKKRQQQDSPPTVDDNGNLPKADETQVRQAVETVFENLVGQKFELREEKENQKTKAVDKQAIFESQQRILSQVKKAKEKGGLGEGPQSPDYKQLKAESQIPLKSILKKPSISMEEEEAATVTTKVTSEKVTTSTSTVYLIKKENVHFAQEYEEPSQRANGHKPFDGRQEKYPDSIQKSSSDSDPDAPALPQSPPPKLPDLEPPLVTMLHHASLNSPVKLITDEVPDSDEEDRKTATPPPSPRIVSDEPPRLVTKKDLAPFEKEFAIKLSSVSLEGAEADQPAVTSRAEIQMSPPITPIGPMGDQKKQPTVQSPSEIRLPTPTHALSRTKVEITKNGVEKLVVEDNAVCRDWDPTPLLERLYEIDYVPRQERKRNRFINMEGHLDHLPLGVKSAFTERQWKEHYFKTKEGRLHWYQTPYADDSSLGDILLAGTDIDINREEHTLSVHGGRDHSRLTLRCQSTLIDKWRQALLSHAASSIYDSYVQPLYPPVPHNSQKLAIIELGSSSVRAGLLTYEPSLPQAFFPTLATRLPDDNIIVGCKALKPEYRHAGTVVRPILPSQPGIERYTMDMELMEDIFRHAFELLKIDHNQYKVLLSVPHNASVQLLSELLSVLLRELEVPSATVMRQPCLVLYAYDVTTGVVVDIGDRLNIVPVVDGYVVENAIVSLPYGSGCILDSLRAKLCEQNVGLYAFVTDAERYILRYIAEQSCYVAADYEAEVAKSMNEETDSIEMNVSLDPFYPTPEMLKDFTLDSSRFTSTEGLLKPKRYGLDTKGLHHLIFGAIQSAPMDSRRTLYRNIYLAGGASLLPGLAERLETELSKLVASTIYVQVHMSPWRYHAAYLGAQVLASSPQIDNSMVTAEGLNSFVTKLHAANF